MKRLITILLVLCIGGLVYADGFVVPNPATIARGGSLRDYFSVKYHNVTIDIDGQDATTVVDQAIKNESGGNNIQAVYLFPAPKDANITTFDMFVGEKKMEGKIYPKDEARKIYNDIVRRKCDPALLEYIGRGVYQTSVFPFAKDETRQLKIKYSELLRKDTGFVYICYPLNTERFSKYPLESVKIVVNIKSKTSIKNIYSPSHEIQVNKLSDTEAQVIYQAKNVVPQTDFELYYSAEDGDIGANLITYKSGGEGYFLLMATPKINLYDTNIPSKDVIFVLDKSGSMMTDNKIGQAQEALNFCIKALNPKDRFGIIAFSDNIEKYKDELIAASPEERAKAAAYVNTIGAGGGTNINDTLKEALVMLKNSDRLKFIIFLTDGQPTVGETDINKILANVRGENDSRTRIFSFGVGYDLNVMLLDKLAQANFGYTEYVQPNQSIEGKVSRFYTKVNTPALSDIKVDFGDMKITELHPRKNYPDIFVGSELVVSGKYKSGGNTKVTITGTVNGEAKSYSYNLTFSDEDASTQKFFVEKLWAGKQIGYLLDQLRLNGGESKPENKEIISEVVRLSTKYGIVTEYTSYLILENDINNIRDREFSGRVAVRGISDAMGAGKAEFDKSAVVQSKALKKLQESAQGLPSSEEPEVLGALSDNKVFVSQMRQTLQQAGNKTFYFKNNIWEDAEIAKDAKVVNVEYFSDDFFKLLESEPTLNQYISQSQGADVKVQIKDKVYHFTQKQAAK